MTELQFLLFGCLLLLVVTCIFMVWNTYREKKGKKAIGRSVLEFLGEIFFD